MRVSVGLFCILTVPAVASAQSPAATGSVPLLAWEYRTGDPPLQSDGWPQWADAAAQEGWKALSRWGQWDRSDGAQTVWLRARLPDVLPERPALYLQEIPAGLEVYIARRRTTVAEAFATDEGSWHVNPARPQFIRVPAAAAGQWVTFRAWDRGSLRLSFSQPLVGAEDELRTTHLRRNLPYGALGCLFLCTAFTALILIPQLSQRRALFFLAALCCGFGWLSLDRAGLLGLVLDVPQLRTAGLRLSLATMGVWIPALLAELLPAFPFARWLRWLSALHFAACIVATILYLTHLLHPDTAIRFMTPLLIANIGTVAILLLMALRRGYHEVDPMVLAGLISLGLSAMTGAIASLVTAKPVMAHLLPVGFAVFLVALAVQMVRRLFAATRAEAAGLTLQHSEARFRALTENALDMLYLLDAGGRYLFASQSSQNGTGSSPVELYGTSLFDRVHPDDQADLRSSFGKLLEKQESPVMLEYRFLHHDGAWRVHEARASNQLANPNVAGVVLNVRDITSRRRNEQELRQREAMLRSLVDNLPFDFWALDADGRYMILAATSVRSMGSAVGKRPDEMDVPAETLELWHGLNQRAFRGEVVKEETFCEAFGKRQHTLNIIAPILDGDYIRGVVGVGIDIDERIRTEERQRGLEAERAALLERFRTILTSMPIACIVTDERFCITFWNAAAERLFGYAADEVLGKHPAERVAPLAAQPLFTDAFQRLANGESSHSTTENIARDGRSLLCEWHHIPLRGADGRFSGVISMCQDVTERERSADALRLTESRFELTCQATRDGIYDWDLRTGRIWRSSTYTDLFGSPAGPDDEYDFWERRIHPNDLERVLAGLRDCFAGRGDTWNAEYRFRRASGDYAYVMDRGCLIRDTAGSVQRVIGAMTDVSRVKEAEEERRDLEARVLQSQKDESLGVLAGGIAQDFNDVLLGVLSNVGLAMSELPPNSSARATLAEIERAAQHASDLCRQLLAYSGRSKFVVRAVDLNNLLQESRHLLEVSIPRPEVLQYRLSEAPQWIEGDAGQIRQVVVNLVMNAAEALDQKGGTVTVSTGMMLCDRRVLADTTAEEELVPGPYAFLQVTDDGCGMAEDVRERIFDPFFSTKFSGRGLGLAAVLGIVRGHHGAIKVVSRPGQGSTFRVLLPVTGRRMQQVITIEPSIPEWTGSGTVLVIDDDEAVRAVARKCCEHAGLSVHCADNGASGVEYFRNHGTSVDVVLLDLTMPGLGGEQVLQQLRQVRPDVRIILSSGYTELEVAPRLNGVIPNGFLPKPWRPPELLACIRAILE